MRSATHGSQSILDISEADMSALNSRFRDARSQVKTGSGTAPTASPDTWVGAAPPERWTAPPFPRPASDWWAEWESQQGDFTDVMKILRRLLLATRPSEVAAKFGVPDAHALLKFDVFITGANPRPLARSVALWARPLLSTFLLQPNTHAAVRCRSGAAWVSPVRGER